MASRVSLPTQVHQWLNFCIAQTVENAFRHAQSTVGPVACARALDDGSVEFAVADCGIDLWASFDGTQYAGRATDDVAAAIKLALKAGVTSEPAGHSEIGMFLTRKLCGAIGGELRVHFAMGSLCAVWNAGRPSRRIGLEHWWQSGCL